MAGSCYFVDGWKTNLMIPRLSGTFFVMCCFLCFPVKAQNITTIAGNGSNGNDGDDGPATCAGIPKPIGLCLDGKGFLYLSVSNSIRKIDLANNIITRVAGSDTYGYSGDGGPAKDALMQNPYYLCLDQKNNLYVSETGGHRIRKINLTTGIVSTFAGNGTAGFSGDGGPASLASLNTPRGICTDGADNIYITDYVNNKIRKVDGLTGIITTIAGNGSQVETGDGGLAVNAGIPLPNSIVTDPAGNIYFAEVVPLVTSRIRKINGATGIITTIAGNNNYAYSGDGGPALNAELFNPVALTLDLSGNIYISENDDSRIRMINASTGIISTIAGNGTNGFGGDGGPAVLGTMNFPRQLAHDGAGNLYVADLFSNRIRKVGDAAAPPPVLPTTLSISASTESSCEGSPVTFIATSVNPGFNAIYQWKVNGNPVNVIQPVFTTSILKNGDLVSCTLLAIVCNVSLQINSTIIKMTVKPGLPPSVSIIASDTAICGTTNVIFTATTRNFAGNVTYQWKRNGAKVGNNSNSYATTSLANGDTVTCEVTGTSASGCGGQGAVTSNPVVMNVQSGQAAVITITSTASEVCNGTPVTFRTATVNAGTNPVYQWTLNGKNTGTNSDTYTINSVSDNDAVVCRLTPGGTACSSSPVNSNEIIIRIKPSPVITLFPKDTLVAPGTQVRLNATVSGQYSGFSWSPSTLLSSSATLTPVTVALNNNAEFKLEIKGTNGCASTANSSIRIYRKLFMPNAFTPNGDNVNDVYRIPPGVSITLNEFSIFDRWGNKVFTTKDITQGWNGTLKGSKSPNGVYTFMIRGADDKGSIVEKGSFTLIR